MQLYSFNPETFSHVSKNLSALTLTSSPPHSEPQSAVPMEILAFHAFKSPLSIKGRFFSLHHATLPTLLLNTFFTHPGKSKTHRIEKTGN